MSEEQQDGKPATTPATLVNVIKSNARKISAERGISFDKALDLAARDEGHTSYQAALKSLIHRVGGRTR